MRGMFDDAGKIILLIVAVAFLLGLGLGSWWL